MEGGSAPDSTEYSFAFGDITSPSQLQEVTLDQDVSFANTMAIKSPNASLRGRSVKDIEEQLTSLRKENFNLKLRIYFLEEKMGSTGFTLDKDNVLKKNIDLQVQIATLQKELKEKHDLLVEAVKAMELNDDEHKKNTQMKEDELVQVQQEVEELRLQLHLQMEKDNNNASMQLLMDQIENLQRRYDASQEESQAKDEQIKVLHDKNSVLNATVAELTIQLGDYKSKLSKLKQENEVLVKRVNADDKRIEELFEQYNELKRKYSMMKNNLEASERVKVGHEMKISKLEYETEKYRSRMKDLQIKLEEAQSESKKNQNLAVSKSPAQKSLASYTDDGFVSVSNPATPAGTPKKDALHVPVAVAKSASVASMPSSPDKFASLEELVKAAAEDGVHHTKILSELQTLRGEHTCLKQKVVKLKSEQIKACEIIRSMIESRNKSTEEINQLKKQNQELEKELESVVSKPTKEKLESVPLSKQIAELNITAVSTQGRDNEKTTMAEAQAETAETLEHYKVLTAELEAKIEVLLATVEENDSQMHSIRNQYEELLKILQEKDNRITDLEFELLSCNQDTSRMSRFSLEKGDVGTEKQIPFEKIIEEKDKEIEKLNSELKKCTCYLQEIVNKELWEKNREIEKLHLKNESAMEVIKLRKELSDKNLQLKVLKEKISEFKIEGNTSCNVTEQPNIEKKILEERIQQLEAQIAGENLDSLKSENDLLRNELLKCENLRKGSNEACNILSTRLEELATFLDSLLKQKSVLGFLGLSKNKRIRQVIDNTLDLSRSFTANMSINPDQSLTQLSNISALLDESVKQDLSLTELEAEEDAHFSIVPANITLTYHSHLYKKEGDNTPFHEQVIAALREQVFNLKSELQLRDAQLNDMQHKEYTDKTTDTDDDKNSNVKLFNTTSTTLKALSEAHSESEAWSEPDRRVSRARIGLNQTAPASIKSTHQYCGDSTEEDSCNSLTLSPSKRRQTVIELQQHISQLEEELKRRTIELNSGDCDGSKKSVTELEIKLKETEQKLEEAELRKTDVDKQLRQLQEVVDSLLSSKKELEVTMSEKDKSAQNMINELISQKEEALCKVSEFEKEALDAKNEIKMLKEKILQIHSTMDEMESNLRKEYQECTVIKLRQIEEEFLLRTKMVEQKAQSELEDYRLNYLHKSDVEKKLADVEVIKNELNNLKETVHSYEETIESYKLKEQAIVSQLELCQNKNNNLRKELDDITLKYSEVVLEKTKIVNEKAGIEQELRKINDIENKLKQDLKQIQSELHTVSINYQEQIANFQQQNTKLEIKISELESTNAELYNRLVRVQGSHNDFNLSMPNLVSRSASVRGYKRQCSDQNYNSEDNMDARNLAYASPAVRNIPGEADRQEATSSPDLGIESDHGRFSSLETQPNMPRPIFPNIPLTDSMKNLLHLENNFPNEISCGAEHCCQKTLEIIQENQDLRRELLRMKKALEETAKQLNLANQRKKQVEKTICKQIHKTSQVLRKAKANLDSGSESDVFKM